MHDGKSTEFAGVRMAGCGATEADVPPGEGCGQGANGRNIESS